MQKKASTVRERIRKQDPEFRKLEEAHQRLEAELNRIVRHKVLTPKEEISKKQIQVEKLHMKDRIEDILRRHRTE